MHGCRADARSCMRRWKSEGQQGRLREKEGGVRGRDEKVEQKRRKEQ